MFILNALQVPKFVTVDRLGAIGTFYLFYLALSPLIRVSSVKIEWWVPSIELIPLNVYFENRTRLNNTGSDIFRHTSRINVQIRLALSVVLERF